MFWVISVYFNIGNTLPKSGTFLLGHPVYIYNFGPLEEEVEKDIYLFHFALLKSNSEEGKLIVNRILGICNKVPQTIQF